MQNREELFMALTALLAALLIASSQVAQSIPVSLPGTYLYWIVRIAIEALLFFTARQVLERYLTETVSFAWVTGIAIVVSHVLFVLSVTAMDIVLGYPELGIGTAGTDTQSRVQAFALELLYLSDNHIALCLLLSLPRLALGAFGSAVAQSAAQRLPGDHESVGELAPTLLSAIEPPLDGQVIWAEAQEHYVRITTGNEVRMVLCRFSDIVRELPDARGMQVHRSHWVACSAIADAVRDGQNMKLVLLSGDSVPVSRSFRSAVETRLAQLPASIGA
ncbi:LytTR family transcriptional regulator DNA-binding domain-containing protein [Anderseniella sp. Alg231-50]|uniref:LytTR family transcriptional regulator DNA-binding domain-containing protein n=1 Tax=Anderseniella sp. Alg231-50 TaxID=1922226 RepID=UPI000D54D14C